MAAFEISPSVVGEEISFEEFREALGMIASSEVKVLDTTIVANRNSTFDSAL